jgi:hypothetical protein
MESDGGVILTRENRKLEKKLFQCHIVHQKSHTENAFRTHETRKNTQTESTVAA